MSDPYPLDGLGEDVTHPTVCADWPGPVYRLTATKTWLRPTCLVLWHGGIWGGPVPTFVSETRARVSVASEITRLVERGLN